MSEVVGSKGLSLELVQKTNKIALGGLNDRSSVLPDGVFRIVPAADGVTLVLMDVVYAEACCKWFTEDVKSNTLRYD